MTNGTIHLGDRLVLATHNAGKLAELRAMLEPMGITVLGAADCGLTAPAETADTFEGNAAIKAEAASEATNLPALADDSGLVVEALGGDPGVNTAGWALEGSDYAAGMARVLSGLEAAGALEAQARRATFISVLALARPRHETVFFKGRVEGRIAEEPRGTGFGYDPIFIPGQGDGRTFGEMSREEKAGVHSPLSHRARAVAAFTAALATED
jgi:XTP/dITP diphosphohydrolase